MKALIDADIFTYSFGSCKTDEGHPLAWPLVATRLNAQIKNICDAVGATSYTLYITGQGNFRESIATIKPYKGSRPNDKPYWYEQVRRYLINYKKAILVEGWEADDQLAMEQMKDYHQIHSRMFKSESKGNNTLDVYYDYKRFAETIICSVDKDLDMVPGLHYNWIKDEIYTITELDGLRNFYCQLLTGDTVDNIPGLFGVGKSSKLLTDTRSFTSEWDMFSFVLCNYEKRFGSYAWQFLIENAQLLWMVRDKECELKEMEIVNRLKNLRKQTIGQDWKKRLLNNLN